jgi:hypothetical protein
MLSFLSFCFDEFDVRHVQHELPRALALGTEEALQLQSRVQPGACQQPRLGVERYAADFGLDFSSAARFGLLRLMP